MSPLLQQPWILLSASGVLLAVAGLALLGLLLQVRELRRRDLDREKAVEALSHKLRNRQVAPAARVPDERQLRLERQLDELRLRQERLEMQALESQAYHQAIDWVHRGANTDQLVRKLGLSHGEAELVQALHRARKTG